MTDALTSKVKRGALRADGGDALDVGARIGLVAYGVVHLVLGWTALQLVLGDASGQASQTGAFHEMASSTLGRFSLFVVAGGLAALVVWQGVEAAVGHRDSDGPKRLLKRAGSVGKACIYAVLAVSAAKVAIGEGQGSSGTDSWTAKLMSAPAGQVLVGLVGLGVASVGGYLVFRGMTEKFTRDLDSQAVARDRRTPIAWAGKVGYVAKGLAFVGVGALFVLAAVEHEAKKSGGLDQALHQLLQQPFGPVLVAATALGFAAFGLYCFAWARHLDR